MKMNGVRAAAAIGVLMCAACAGPAGVGRLSEDTAKLKVECVTDPKIPNASYVGPNGGPENNLSPLALSQDLYCAHQFRVEKFPNGFVTILGDARIVENNTGSHYAWINQLNNDLYFQLMSFAQRWSSQHGGPDGYPILTAGGAGLMEAAARGAMSGSGVSIGYGASVEGSDEAVFARYPIKGVLQPMISDGLIFSSAAMRDYAMISQSSAIIVAPGGLSARGVLLQMLDLIRTHRLQNVPIYLVGDRKFYWAGWSEMKDKMILDGTVTQAEFDSLQIEFVENPIRVIDRLETRLGLKTPPYVRR